jgi:hypothetical protein
MGPDVATCRSTSEVAVLPRGFVAFAGALEDLVDEDAGVTDEKNKVGKITTTYLGCPGRKAPAPLKSPRERGLSFLSLFPRLFLSQSPDSSAVHQPASNPTTSMIPSAMR